MTSYTTKLKINNPFSSAAVRVPADKPDTPGSMTPMQLAQWSKAVAASIIYGAVPFVLLMLPYADTASSKSILTQIHAPLRRRKGRRITVDEARRIALRAMQLTDALFAEDRRREIVFLRSIADADDEPSR
jgi:hypothetical protein